MADKQADLEARLSAQRLVLEWLLENTVTNTETLDNLINHVDAKFPPQDHQEDPGAVTTEAFGSMASATAELRLLLNPLKKRLGKPEDAD